MSKRPLRSSSDEPSRSGVSELSRRDKRTQPGVLTPGIDKKWARPEGAEEPGWRYQTWTQDLKRTVCHPFRVRSWIGPIPGVKTPGSVLYPFRINPMAPQGPVSSDLLTRRRPFLQRPPRVFRSPAQELQENQKSDCRGSTNQIYAFRSKCSPDKR
jgi:hypothetical protein